MRTVGLTVKLFRFELVAAALAMLALAATLLILGRQLAALQIDQCQSMVQPGDCGQRMLDFNALEGPVRLLQLLTVALPVFASLIVGVAAVGREIERGTAAMPWTIGLSRTGWLLRRVSVLGAILALLAILPAVAGHMLEAARDPMVDPSRSFAAYDTRGTVVVIRAAAAFLVAAGIGAVIGRVLPALIVSTVVASLVLVGVGTLVDANVQARAVELPATPGRSGDLVLDIRYRNPAGTLVTYAEAMQELAGSGTFPEDAYPMVRMGVPGPEQPAVTLLSVTLLTGVGFVAMVLCVAVVERRRPI